MERFPRGTLPPSAFKAVATVAPTAIARPPEASPSGVTAAAAPVQSCDLTTTCPTCLVEMQREHAHYRCAKCGYRDSCCF